MTNANDGIRYSLTCSSNRSTLTCRESESVFVHDLRNIIVEQIKMIKSNPLVFRKHLNHAFIKDLEPIKAKIAFIDEQINYLKDKLVNCTDKKNDAYKALNDEVSSRVENLMTEKKVLENNLLTQQISERIIKEIMKIVDSLPIDEYNPDFRKLFKRL